ncbi:MAG: hypothetical protein JO076_08010 [Verrucomicrobia bacterium]|nr:hypothetical protein [Verrucomicrobiota bacterium]
MTNCFVLNRTSPLMLVSVQLVIAWSSIANACTVIALYSKPGQPPDQHYQYEHHGHNAPGSAVEKLAFAGVNAEGGINPKLWFQQVSPR